MSRILILPASFRKTSLNRALSQLAASILESKGHTVDLADMAEFETPSYNEDAEGGAMPAGAVALNQRLLDSDAFIIASPEFNGSMPGYLKNTLDCRG
jgi:NAD(P)H-dependent FMN reductase